jgi:hypothetical protein
MKIELSDKEKLDFFYTALCNGCNYIKSYGIAIKPDGDLYNKSKVQLDKPCYEDVLIQMLKDGHPLEIVDYENGGEYTRSITIKDVYEKMGNVPMDRLIEMQQERDDAITADVIIQTIFFNEVIFG